MALPPPTGVEMGHFTRFWERRNYPQSCCTRPYRRSNWKTGVMRSWQRGYSSTFMHFSFSSPYNALYYCTYARVGMDVSRHRHHAPRRVSGRSETKTYGKSAVVRECDGAENSPKKKLLRERYGCTITCFQCIARSARSYRGALFGKVVAYRYRETV